MKFFCPVTPTAKGRPRFGKGRTYTPEKTVKATKLLVLYLLGHRPELLHEGPVSLKLLFLFDLPKSRSPTDYGGPHQIKPDLDNLVKLVMDAMTKCGGWWKDDSQAFDVQATKRWVERGSAQGVWIEFVAVGS